MLCVDYHKSLSVMWFKSKGSKSQMQNPNVVPCQPSKSVAIIKQNEFLICATWPQGIPYQNELCTEFDQNLMWIKVFQFLFNFHLFIDLKLFSSPKIHTQAFNLFIFFYQNALSIFIFCTFWKKKVVLILRALFRKQSEKWITNPWNLKRLHGGSQNLSELQTSVFREMFKPKRLSGFSNLILNTSKGMKRAKKKQPKMAIATSSLCKRIQL